MQEEAVPHSLSDRVLNILEQLLQQGQQLYSDSSDDSDNEEDDAQEGVANQIVDVLVDFHLLEVPNYSEDVEVRLHEAAELLPQLAPEKTSRFRRCRGRRRAGNKNVGARSPFAKKRSYSDEVLSRFRSRSPLRVRERTPP